MLQFIENNWPAFASAVAIVLLTILLAYLINRFFLRLIRKSTAHLNNDPTNYHFLRHSLRAIVYIVGFSIAIFQVPQLRTVASTLLAGAGVLAVAVGFAAQHALSNIISGIFIIIFKPFRINDRLTIGPVGGVVEDITLRHTVIRDFENRRVLIPNSRISDDVIVNADFTDERICRFIEMDISYDSDPELARRIMQEEVTAHPLSIDVRTPEQLEAETPRVMVRVLSLGDSSVNMRAWAWAKDQADAFAMGCELLESIKKRFDQEGVEIPFPHRTIVQKQVVVEKPTQ
ncbi:MAG: mechanosensitive ion channel family protein [Bacteroidota bacterium]